MSTRLKTCGKTKDTACNAYIFHIAGPLWLEQYAIYFETAFSSAKCILLAETICTWIQNSIKCPWNDHIDIDSVFA